jgi:hypothetical protein
MRNLMWHSLVEPLVGFIEDMDERGWDFDYKVVLQDSVEYNHQNLSGNRRKMVYIQHFIGFSL